MKRHFLFLSVLMTMFMSMLSLKANAQLTYTAISGTAGFASEGYANLFDGATSTKWCCSFSNAYGVNVVFKTSESVRVDGYVITTANDSRDNNGARNPKNWVLTASADSVNWDTLHSVVDDQTIQAVNLTAYTFRLPAPTTTAYRFFRWHITAIHSSNVFQASEFSLIYPCEHNTGMTHHDATVANCVDPAYRDYWTCNLCGRMFTDSAATHLVLTKDSLITAPVGGHNYVDGVCTICGHHEHAQWDVNLLTNSKPTTATGFSGWTATADWTIVDTCFATTYIYGLQILTQTVDLETMGFAAGETDGKQVWTSVDVAVPAGTNSAYCCLKLTYLKADGTTISSSTCWDKSYSGTELPKQTRAWVWTIPNGTAKITYELRGRSQNTSEPLTYTDMTLKVLQTAPTTYRVNINSEQNGVSLSINNSNVVPGTLVTLYTSNNYNHVFGGFHTTPEVTWLEDKMFVMPASNVTVKVYSDRTTKYKITTVSCEGFTISCPKDSTYSGDTIRLQRVKSEGFSGYSIASDNSSIRWINDSAFLMPAGNLTLTAKAISSAARLAVLPQVEGVTYSLEDNAYCWVPVDSATRAECVPGLMSNNKSIPSTDAQTTITFTLPCKMRLSYSYYVSSETNYDKISTFLDGVERVSPIGSQSGLGGNDTTAFLRSGSHALRLVYHKDGSSDYGLDRGFIYNMKFEAAPFYAVSATSSEHIALTASMTQANEGDTIAIATIRQNGYAIDSIATSVPVVWLDANHFIMPASAVAVTVVERVTLPHTITATVSDAEHATISALQQAYVEDTVTVRLVVDSLYHYDISTTPASLQWINDSTFIMPDQDVTISAEVEPIPSAVLAIWGEPYVHTIVIRGNDTLSAGDLVYDGDVLDIEFASEVLLLSFTNYQDYVVSVSADTLTVGTSYMSVNTPKVRSFCPDSSTCVFTFAPTIFTGYDFVLLPEKCTDYNKLATMKGRRHLNDTTYTVVGLVPGNTYYAYVRANDSIVGESAWREKSFVAAASGAISGGPCLLHFEMADEYCDGWNGAFISVYVDGQFLENVEPNYESCTDSYDLEIEGSEVQLMWMGSDGHYGSECSCTITDASGNEVVSFDKNSMPNSNFELYSDYLCAAPCASLDSIVVVNDGDDITITWGSADAVSYNILLSQNSMLSHDQLDSLATSTTATSYNFQAQPAKGYLFYYQLVCAEGETTPWHYVEAFSDSVIPCENEEDAARLTWTPLTLDTIIEGNVLEDLYIVNGGRDNYFSRFYSLSLEDSTEVTFIYQSQSHNGGMSLFDDTLGYITGFEASTMTLDSGKYHILLYEESYNTNYKFTMQTYRPIAAVDTIKAVPYLSDTIRMDDAQLYIESSYYMYDVRYAVIVPDTMEVTFRLTLVEEPQESSYNYYIQLNDSNDSSINGSYSAFTEVLLPGYCYSFDLISSSPTAAFQIRLESAGKPLSIIPVLTDTLYSGHISTNDDLVYMMGSSRAAKLYSFTLEETTTVSPVFLKESLSSSICFVVMSDTVGSNVFYTSSYNVTPSTSGFSTTLSAGTYYMAVYTYYAETDYLVGLRKNYTPEAMAYSPADTIVVGQLDTIEAGLNHHFSTMWWSGDVATAKIWLEENKTYYFFGEHEGVEDIYVGAMVLMEDEDDPEMDYTTSYDERGISYYFEPEESGYYTLAIFTGAYGYSGTSYYYSMDEYSYNVILRVDTAMPFLDYVAQVDTIDSLPYRADFDMLSMPLVGWDGSYYFVTPHSQRTCYTGKGHNTFAVHAVVQPGDTLFAELTSAEDGVLYIYPFEDSNYSYGHLPISADENEETEPEYTYFVNEADTAQTVTVIATLYDCDFYGDPIPSTLRLSKSETAFEMIVVTADASEDLIYLDEASVVAALDTLTRLSISVLDSTGATIAELTNDARWWTVDFAAGKAYYELADSDLPIGYTFGSEDPYFVTVDLVVRQLVYAAANKESVTITDKSEAAVREVLAAEVSITVSDATGLLIQTFDSESACWSAWTVDLATMKASITLTDAMLAPEYRFEGGEAVVTIDINGIFTAVENISTDTTTAGAIKRIENDHIVIETANGRVFDATGRLIR